MTIQHFSQRKTGRKARPMTLSDALADYKLFQKAKRSDPKTIYANEYAVKKLLGFLGENPPLEEIDARELRAFMAWFIETPTRFGTPPKTQAVHTVYCKLRTFFRWCEAEGYVEETPLKRLNAPRLDKNLLPALSSEELAILDKALQGKDSESVRDRAMVYTMLDSGIRLQECADLKVADLNTETGALLVRMGKGRKDRIVRVGSVTLRCVNRYLRMSALGPDDHLWQGKRGPMTRWGVRAVFDRLTERTGIHLHPHKMRRTTALMMLRNGCDIYSLQHLLGHAELDTLRKYLAQTQADITTAHQRFGVMDNLKR